MSSAARWAGGGAHGPAPLRLGWGSQWVESCEAGLDEHDGRRHARRHGRAIWGRAVGQPGPCMSTATIFRVHPALRRCMLGRAQFVVTHSLKLARPAAERARRLHVRLPAALHPEEGSQPASRGRAACTRGPSISWAPGSAMARDSVLRHAASCEAMLSQLLPAPPARAAGPSQQNGCHISAPTHPHLPLQAPQAAPDGERSAVRSRRRSDMRSRSGGAGGAGS